MIQGHSPGLSSAGVPLDLTQGSSPGLVWRVQGMGCLDLALGCSGPSGECSGGGLDSDSGVSTRGQEAPPLLQLHTHHLGTQVQSPVC